MDEETVSWAMFVEGWPLFRDPILCAVAAGAALGLLGLYIVLRRMVFVSAVLSQVAGLGITLSFWAGAQLGTEFEPMIGAVVLTLLATFLFTLRPERIHLSRESVLGLFWVGAGAAAIVLSSTIPGADNLASILFGSAVVVRPIDLSLNVALAVLVLGAHALLWRGWVFASFDPDGAKVHGLPVAALDVVLWLSVGLMVSVATRALGALPVFAFSVLPAIAALLSRVPLGWAFPLAAVIGAVAGGSGYLLAFFKDWPVGPAQALVAVALVAVLLIGRAGLRLAGR